MANRRYRAIVVVQAATCTNGGHRAGVVLLQESGASGDEGEIQGDVASTVEECECLFKECLRNRRGNNHVSISKPSGDNWCAYNLISLATWGVRESEFRDNDVKLGELVVCRDDVSLEVIKVVAVPVLMNSAVSEVS